ncbi:MAG: tRNA pseudouridine(55) synthase TruB [Firmicutes bacterium]|nr:tRNA pseudouridine(55) synthase TruB [Bacillota bacterium]
MDGIILVNKPKNVTSRDVVNKVGSLLKTKKIGHTGTLDPIATGVLVLCIGKYTKLVDLITSYEKEYIATVLVGMKTDTLDVTGNVLENIDIKIEKDKLIQALNSFKGSYMQEVPIYSAVKINGKKLYEYARNNEVIDLPKREVEIKNIELLDINNNEFTFKVTVSKGTYIRSLINDIGLKLNIPMCMKELKRTMQGNFKIEDSNTIDDIENNKFNILDIKDILNYPVIKIDNDVLEFQIKNGSIIENKYDNEIIMFELDNKTIAIYKTYEKDTTKLKPYKMFL